jgi:hypothetical protein
LVVVMVTTTGIGKPPQRRFGGTEK